MGTVRLGFMDWLFSGSWDRLETALGLSSTRLDPSAWLVSASWLQSLAWFDCSQRRGGLGGEKLRSSVANLIQINLMYLNWMAYYRCANFRKPALGITGDVWHRKYGHKKEGLTNYLKYSLNRLLKIFLSLRCRAPDPVFGQNRILTPGFCAC